MLIDCGISAAKAQARLAALGLDARSLDAIIVTHEHRDHIYGVSVLSRRCSIPVYVSKSAGRCLGPVHRKEFIKAERTFELDGVCIEPVGVSHDAHEPLCFALTCGRRKFGHVTDLGAAAPEVVSALQGCDALVVESNHDYDLLMACDYPWELKQRILSDYGHLSNRQCGELMAQLWHTGLQRIVLGHISENSNTPALALKTVSGYLPRQAQGALSCGCASCSTPIYDIEEGAQGGPPGQAAA